MRLSWDPFIRAQRFLHGASVPGKGVQTLTKARVGPSMVSEYVSYNPPSNVGMTMVSGPWFFEQFGGGWRFKAERGGTRSAMLPWPHCAWRTAGPDAGSFVACHMGARGGS